MAIKVFILSPFTILRQGLSSLLKEEADFKLVAEAANGKEAMEKIMKFSPEVILIALPNRDTPEVLAWIQKSYPQIKVISLFFEDFPAHFFTMISAGVFGLLVKDFTYEEMARAIRHVASNQAYLNPAATKILLERFQQATGHKSLFLKSLTIREQEVLRLVASGKKTAQIAEQLNIKRKTAEVHRYNLMKKLGFKTVAEVTKYAIQSGLIS
jgi:two-component system, NarL family, response regulator NreC